jgi:hypothetical protein
MSYIVLDTSYVIGRRMELIVWDNDSDGDLKNVSSDPKYTQVSFQKNGIKVSWIVTAVTPRTNRIPDPKDPSKCIDVVFIVVVEVIPTLASVLPGWLAWLLAHLKIVRGGTGNLSGNFNPPPPPAPPGGVLATATANPIPFGAPNVSVVFGF